MTGVQFGSGGDSTVAELAAESRKDVGDLIDRGTKALDAGAFVDHSQVLQLEGLRQNIWGNKSTRGRLVNLAPGT